MWLMPKKPKHRINIVINSTKTLKMIRITHTQKKPKKKVIEYIAGITEAEKIRFTTFG